MIGHQAPGYSSTTGRDQSFVEIQESLIIVFSMKYALPVITLVIDMIKVIRLELHFYFKTMQYTVSRYERKNGSGGFFSENRRGENSNSCARRIKE